MTNLSVEQVLMIVGGKEIDLVLLRNENAELRKRLSAAEARIAELEKPKDEASVTP